VARVLIVGCGCRGRELGEALATDGHAVRGTSRTEGGRAAIAAAGLEAVEADPDRVGTLMAHLAGTSVVCWLMGSAEGEAAAVEAVHGPRLKALLQRLVDSGVRGLVYEGAGTAPAAVLVEGAEEVRLASARWRMPAEVVLAEPAGPEWVPEMRAAVVRVLGA
jgi:hypothetical protein